MNYAEINAKIETLIAENQKLGEEIDTLRDKRRAINSECATLRGLAAVVLAAESNPDVAKVLGLTRVDAAAPGAVIEVDGKEIIRQFGPAALGGN